MGRQYTVYRIESPSGRAYVGVTSTSPSERWRQHRQSANAGVRRPFAAAIRKYGADNFTHSVLGVYDTEDKARRAEAGAIAGNANGYNVSPGGDYDATAGAARLKELMADSAWRSVYCARVSAGVRRSTAHNAHTRGEASKAAVAKWRAANPRQAYKNAHRAQRVAARSATTTGENARRRAARPANKLQERAKRSAEAASGWAALSAEQRKQRCANISAAKRARNSLLTDEEKRKRNAQLAEARKSIDHDIRKARQREGVAAYWGKNENI